MRPTYHSPINTHSSLPTLHGRHQVVAQRRAVSLSPCLKASSNSWQQSNNNDEMTGQQAYDGPTHGLSLIYNNSSVPHSTQCPTRLKAQCPTRLPQRVDTRPILLVTSRGLDHYISAPLDSRDNGDAMGMNSTMTQITFSLKTTCMFPSCTSRSRPLGPVRGSGGRLER
jgi:hypothetical protein